MEEMNGQKINYFYVQGKLLKWGWGFFVHKNDVSGLESTVCY